MFLYLFTFMNSSVSSPSFFLLPPQVIAEVPSALLGELDPLPVLPAVAALVTRFHGATMCLFAWLTCSPQSMCLRYFYVLK